MSRPDKIIYIVNTRIPNERAHGIQIVHTVEALSQQVKDFVLLTPLSIGTVSHKRYPSSNVHKRLPSLDSSRAPILGFYLRTVTFIFSLYFYLLYTYIKSKYRRQKVVLYVRGEIIFGLIPFFKLFPVYFETHYIRNHERSYAWILKHVTGIIVITDRLKSKFVDEFKIDAGRIAVARDAVNIEAFASWDVHKTDMLRSQFPPDKKIAMYSGSLGHEKGAHTLADAASALTDLVHVVFVGGLDSQLIEFRKKYGGIENISIVGRVDYAEIPNYLHFADILVLPDLATDPFSNLYTSPMKLFEYMASGISILASDVPSLKEVLSERNAFFFRAGNIEDLVKAIKNMLSKPEPDKSRTMAARDDVNDFSWQKRSNLILDLICSFK